MAWRSAARGHRDCEPFAPGTGIGARLGLGPTVLPTPTRKQGLRAVSRDNEPAGRLDDRSRKASEAVRSGSKRTQDASDAVSLAGYPSASPATTAATNYASFLSPAQPSRIVDLLPQVLDGHGSADVSSPDGAPETCAALEVVDLKAAACQEAMMSEEVRVWQLRAQDGAAKLVTLESQADPRVVDLRAEVESLKEQMEHYTSLEKEATSIRLDWEMTGRDLQRMALALDQESALLSQRTKALEGEAKKMQRLLEAKEPTIQAMSNNFSSELVRLFEEKLRAARVLDAEGLRAKVEQFDKLGDTLPIVDVEEGDLDAHQREAEEKLIKAFGTKPSMDSRNAERQKRRDHLKAPTVTSLSSTASSA